MKLQFKIIFRRSSLVVAEVEGTPVMDSEHVSANEVITKIIETEQFLEKITGLRVHIELVR